MEDGILCYFPPKGSVGKWGAQASHTESTSWSCVTLTKPLASLSPNCLPYSRITNVCLVGPLRGLESRCGQLLAPWRQSGSNVCCYRVLIVWNLPVSCVLVLRKKSEGSRGSAQGAETTVRGQSLLETGQAQGL